MISLKTFNFLLLVIIVHAKKDIITLNYKKNVYKYVEMEFYSMLNVMIITHLTMMDAPRIALYKAVLVAQHLMA